MIEETWQFSETLIEIFYTTSKQPHWQELADKTGLSCDECERQWKVLTRLSQTLAKMPVFEPSQMTLNRLSVLAREPLAKRLNFWQKFIFPYRAAWSFSFVVLLAVVSFRFVGFDSTTKNQPQLAQQSKPRIYSPLLNEAINQRMLQTTLDEFAHFVHESSPKQSRQNSQPRFFSLATPASVGANSYNLDSDKDDDLFKADLTSKEVESLFFRARKFERQGYYREALKDYQFLAQFYPDFMPIQTVHIAMARCLEGLHQESTALELLQKSQEQYGASKELLIMIEQLKSQTF